MGIRKFFADGLANVVTGLGTAADQRMARGYVDQILSPKQIMDAYNASAMLRKAITIPATDRVRAWRNWDADKELIAKIEAEEKRLQLKAKVRQAEILRGLGGAALILVTSGDPSMPINPRAVREGGLVAVNLVSRWHLTGNDWNDDLSTPNYGDPGYWTLTGSKSQQRLHPSRVVCFRADPLPVHFASVGDDLFWGRGRVPTLIDPAKNLDEALDTFSALLKDSRNIDVGIPRLMEMLSTEAGEAQITKRLSLMSQAASIINANVYDAGDGEGKGGESIDRHQMTWTGMPEMIRAYAEAFAAASDIPMTRLWGISPAGMNATGQHDTDNWNKMVETGQSLELAPCLDQIDVALIPSALGAPDPEVWWQFAPLDVPSEKEETDRFKVWSDAMKQVADMRILPDRVFNQIAQNAMNEAGWAPGYDTATEGMGDDELYGLSSDANDDLEDPSAITEAQAAKGGDPIVSPMTAGQTQTAPRRRAANDARFADSAEPKTLYVERKLLNADEVIRWAKTQGIETTLTAADMHVTIAYSRAAVDWFAVGDDWSSDQDGNLRIKPGGPRTVERLGDGDAVALLFQSNDLQYRHDAIRNAGASWDWPDYRPHITLTWNADGVDVSAIEPYQGPLVFGPELFSELDEDWRSGIKES